MLRVNNVKVGVAERGCFQEALLRKLRLKAHDVLAVSVFRESLDARRKSDIRFVYSLNVTLKNEERFLSRNRDSDVTLAAEYEYTPVSAGSSTLGHRPVVIGMGPAGLFAALLLAEAGFRPLVVDRGRDVDTRSRQVARFWSAGVLDAQSNVQFGEGGAGAFSDGKLTTLIRDPRCRLVLEKLVEAGAPPEILYRQHPHVGTDLLRGVVRRMRERLLALGAEVVFGTLVEDFAISGGSLRGLCFNGLDFPCDVAVLAPGHSARDTYQRLFELGIAMEAKPFSVGARIEHPQSLIDVAQYGAMAGHPNLGPAEYKLSYHGSGGRSAYTFCMCPGGHVVGAASEDGGVVTNGMSLHARRGPNANSAVLVGVSPEDFGRHPLAGVVFQRRLERQAYEAGGGAFMAPCQRVEDFLLQRDSSTAGSVQPSYRPGVKFGSLEACLPGYVTATMREALTVWHSRLQGYALPDALLTGVETRSSAPVRILRGEDGQSSVKGIYPAGEGAGYAGGIMSAAVDGIRAAEYIISRFTPGGA